MLVVRLARSARVRGPAPDPWIRRRDVARWTGPVVYGALARVEAADGKPVGYGLADPDAPIAVRLISTGPAAPSDDWLERRVAAAVARRARLGLGTDRTNVTGYREINGEGDGLPGLFVDRYGDDRVIAVRTAPMAALLPRIRAALANARPAAIAWLQRAGTAETVPVADDLPAAPPASLAWREGDLHLVVPRAAMQKTGGYLDQRENRRFVARLVGPGARMLDVGTHAGGFAVAAARAGAFVVATDASTAALDAARENARRNEVRHRVEFVRADMFTPMDDPRLAGPFDGIVADPPKMAAAGGRVRHVVAALASLARTLTDRLVPGGVLVLCSCSRNLTETHLDEAVARTGHPFHRIALLGPAPCHPTAPMHAGGTYLRVGVYQRGGDAPDFPIT